MILKAALVYLCAVSWYEFPLYNLILIELSLIDRPIICLEGALSTSLIIFPIPIIATSILPLKFSLPIFLLVRVPSAIYLSIRISYFNSPILQRIDDWAQLQLNWPRVWTIHNVDRMSFRTAAHCKMVVCIPNRFAFHAEFGVSHVGLIILYN